MNEVKVTIKLHMNIPKSWKLVNHPDGSIVMDIGDGQFLTMTFTPMMTSQATDQAKWTKHYDDAIAENILGMVTQSKTKMERLRG